MKKYRDFVNEINEDERPSKKDKTQDKRRRKDKKIKNALKTKNIQELMELEDDY